MDLYGRPTRRQPSTPPVGFLNDHFKTLSFSSGRNKVSQRRRDDDTNLSDHSSSTQHECNQQQSSLAQQRSASSRSLNRPQSSRGVRQSKSFTLTHEAKQRPRTACSGVRSLPMPQTFSKKSRCFTQDTEGAECPEVDGLDCATGLIVSSPSLDEQYLQQLKTDILHLHRFHRQLEKEASDNENNGADFVQSAASSVAWAPNHVKNLLLHRDSKANLPVGRSSQHSIDMTLDSRFPTNIEAQLLRFKYSPDSAQLIAAKTGLEGLLADTLIALMELCLVNGVLDESDRSEQSSDHKALTLKLVRPSCQQQRSNVSILPFANGCGISPVSIYAGSMVSVLQRTEVLKRSVLARTGEKNILAKTIADKDSQIKHLTEQIGFFKDTLAQKRSQTERYERVQGSDKGGNTCKLENVESSNQLKSKDVTEQLARLVALEKDRVELLISIRNLDRQKEELEQQSKEAHIELQSALLRLKTAEKLHEEGSKLFEAQAAAMKKHTTDLQLSLALALERYRTLEDFTTKEKTQLRRKNEELMLIIRLKEDQAEKKQAQVIAKAAQQAQYVTQQLNQAQKELDALQLELKAAQTDNKHAQVTIRCLRHDLNVRNEDVEELSSKLAIANATVDNKTTLLQQVEARSESSSKEIEHQQTLLEEQACQVQFLEAKLSRSIPVDDEELQSRQRREKSTWHQQVSALKHALIAERQHAVLFRDQQRKIFAMEQEKAVHAAEQAQAVAAELATANLCLLERKRQREQEQTTFKNKLKEYTDRITQLSTEKDVLERELNAIRLQQSQLHHMKPRTFTCKGMKEQEADAMADRQQLQMKQIGLDQHREAQEAVERTQKNDHKVLQQIIVLLVQRLHVLMTLLDTKPVSGSHSAQNVHCRENDKLVAATLDAAAKSTSDTTGSWREMQQKLEALREELENFDWESEHMRSLLYALQFEYFDDTLIPLDGKQSSPRSPLLSGFYGFNPFSSAVAVGRDVVPIAEQLIANRLLSPGERVDMSSKRCSFLLVSLFHRHLN